MVSIDGNWELRRFTRREALAAGGAVAAALALRPDKAFADHVVGTYGPLVHHPEGNISLPKGFQYRILSPVGSTLSDGRPVPGDPDGMAAFNGPGNTTVLVRNHELGFQDDHIQGVVGTNPYNPAERGGTTAIVVGRNRKELGSYVTSSGTANNCAGGATPWGTWLTCEEDRDAPHGYVFEVMWDDPENDLSKTPITDMGFFSHEAVDIDPATGIAYLTEDDFRGRIERDPNLDTRSSFLYRYIPNDTSRRPGALQKGGTLQALALDEVPATGRDADFFAEGQRFGVRWVTVRPETAAEDALAHPATIRFNRLEGAHFAGGAFWFDDTAGGEKRFGQMYRYLPATETLELFFEGETAEESDAPDNVVVTPWGDVWFAEDGRGENRVMGITPEGHVYKFASTTGSEFAGPTFAPDGRTFFLNAQDHGLTYAIWGPFARRNRTRQTRMARANPPARFAPKVSGELREAARRHGLTDLEAAAYAKLGAPLV